MILVIDNDKGYSDKRIYFVTINDWQSDQVCSILGDARSANNVEPEDRRHHEFPHVIARATSLEWFGDAPLRSLRDLMMDDYCQDFPHVRDCPAEYLPWDPTASEPCTCWVGKLLAALSP